MKIAARIALLLAFGLAACGGPASTPSVAGSARLLPQQRAALARPDRAPSWMRNGAKSDALLYVSDTESGDVYVFNYPKGTPAGTLTGLTDPGGECVDAKGDVFVTNTGGSNVVEYAHGATAPTTTLKDPGFFPIGCAVDPKTGNLAVTNFSSSSSGPGNIVIYTHAKGKPGKPLTDVNTPQFLLCGYDPSGNLYADGLTSDSAFSLVELPAGKKSLVPVALDKGIGNPGAVQWDGKFLAIGDQADNAVDRFAMKATKGSFQSATILKNAIAVFQFWIEGGSIIGPDSGAASVEIWKYPAGGNPQKSLRGVYVPLGTVVSNP